MPRKRAQVCVTPISAGLNPWQEHAESDQKSFILEPVSASKTTEDDSEVAILHKAEADLVALAKRGDTRAFDELVAAHQERVFALAYRMLGNADDAADVQQETFVRAWHSLRRFRGESAFGTWLHRIVVNLCLSRRRRRQPVALEDYMQDSLRSAVDDAAVACVERVETAQVVRWAVADLPAHYRVLIVLRDMEERPFDEIADILGCTVASARTRSSRARNLLRERLKPYIAEDEL